MDRIRSFSGRISCGSISQVGGRDVDELNVRRVQGHTPEGTAKNVLDILSKSDFGEREGCKFSVAVQLLSSLVTPADLTNDEVKRYLYLESAEHLHKVGSYLTKAFDELSEEKVIVIRDNLRFIARSVARTLSIDFHGKLRESCLQTVKELCYPSNREHSFFEFFEFRRTSEFDFGSTTEAEQRFIERFDFRKTAEAERKNELYERKYWNSTPEEAANTILEMLIAGDFNFNKVTRMGQWTTSMSWMLVDKTSGGSRDILCAPREQTIDYFSRALVEIPKDKVEAILISLEAKELRRAIFIDATGRFMLQTIKDLCNSYDEIVANSRKISQAKGNDEDEKSDQPVMRATPEDQSDHERLEMLSSGFSTY
ncbi:hypothetical protein OA90_27460 [Labrenzia sp. OB1]|nr:hypothetical protein OA90_27460 [Labrenzia sp. OB1]